MALGRAWMGSLAGASGAAAVVPAAVVVAVLGAGSLGGLGSLGQLVGGPELPAVERAASSPAAGRDVPALPAPPRRATASTRAVADAGVRAPVTRDGSSGAPEPAPAARPPARPQAPPPAAPAAPTPPSQPTSSPVATPPRPAAPPPAAPVLPAEVTETIAPAASALDGVLRPLPVVGPAAAEAVTAVLALLAPPARP
jgi:translation initiation factor IF-2